jgi:hypothetical protein
VQLEILFVGQLVRGGDDPGGRARHVQLGRQRGQARQLGHVPLVLSLVLPEVHREAPGRQPNPEVRGDLLYSAGSQSGRLADAEVIPLKSVSGRQFHPFFHPAHPHPYGAGRQ